MKNRLFPRMLSFVLAVVMLFSMVPALNISAAETESAELKAEETMAELKADTSLAEVSGTTADGLKYSISDNKVTITDYYGSAAEIVIPSTIDECPVTSIGNYAFEECRSLAGITIPQGVTSIGDWAFSGCISLESITIPEGVTSIGETAFYGCTSLESVTIPKSVTSIGDWAFSYCTSLSSITIPEGVTSIGKGVFSYCVDLESIIADENNSTYDSRDNCNAIIKTATNTLITGCKNTVIPENVTSIGENAFSGCISLESITIPEGVTSIGSGAFFYCTALESITIPEGVPSIGSSAFDGCTSLMSITIPSSVTSIYFAALAGCSNLTHVFYTGKERQWNEISVDGNNHNSLYGDNVTFHYNAQGEGFRFSTTDEATCIKDGADIYECSVCGEQWHKTVEAQGHNFEDGFCTRCNVEEALLLESQHPYENDTDESWSFTKDGAKSISVTFSEDTITEDGYDYICVYDMYDGLVGKYSGDYLAGETITVIGDTVRIRLTSDGSYTDYGFALVDVVVDYGGSSTEPEEPDNEFPYSIDVSDGKYPIVEGYYTVVFSTMWDSASIYCWSDTEGDMASWPGVAMKWALENEYGEKQFVAYIPSEYNNYIINNNGQGEQTVELTIDSSVGMYMAEKQGDKYTIGNWGPEFYDYVPATEPTTPTEATEPTTSTEPDAILGDTDGNGIVSVNDAMVIDKYVAGFDVGAFNKAIADVDDSGTVNVKDATYIQKSVVGLDVATPLQVPVYTPQNNPDEEIYPYGVKVGDKVYFPKEGTTITYTVELTAEKLFENIQASIHYDVEKLELKSIYSDDPDIADWMVEGPVRCPNLSGVVFNAEKDGVVKFCACKINGYNFKDTTVLITLEFDVKDTAYSKIDLIMEEMWIIGGDNAYFTKAQPSVTTGITIEQTLECEEETTSHNMTYSITNGEATLIAYTGDYSDYVIIPEEIRGVSVTAIAEDAFSDADILRVFIPSSVTTIEDYAFTTADAHIVYGGTSSQWKRISIGEGNDIVYYGTRHYNGISDAYEKTIVDASCVEQGYTLHSCIYCDDTFKSDYTDLSDHDYEANVIPPTCQEGGYTEYICSVCTDATRDEYTTTVDHNVVDGECTYCHREFDIVESDHDYLPDTDKTWEISKPGADSITLTFSEKTYVEQYYDFIYIYNAENSLVGRYTGDDLAGAVVEVAGDCAKIRLVSDDGFEYYGFCAMIEVTYTEKFGWSIIPCEGSEAVAKDFLVKEGADGIYTYTTTLAAGTYKFRVQNATGETPVIYGSRASATDTTPAAGVLFTTNNQAYDYTLTATGGKYTFKINTTNVNASTGAIMPKVTVTHEPITDNVVYFINSANWATVYAYAWKDGDNNGWPGVAMTKTDEKINGFDVYSCELDAKYTNIIFTAGLYQGGQTDDLTVQAGQYYYFKDSKWYANKADVPELPAAGTTIKIYFEKPDDWTNAYIYLIGTPDIITYPGVEMKHAEGNKYYYEVPVEANEIKFTDGNATNTKRTENVAIANVVADRIFEVDFSKPTTGKPNIWAVKWDSIDPDPTDPEPTDPDMPTEPERTTMYSVVFVDYDGKFIEVQTIKEGESAESPEAPTRKGYTFVGWDTDFTNVTENLTIKAVYEKISTIPTPAPTTGSLKIEVVGGTGFTIAVDGGKARPQGPSYMSSKTSIGAQITVVPNSSADAEFLGWQNSVTGTVLSTDAEYTFTASGNDSIKALYATKIDGVQMVTFKNTKSGAYGRVLDSQYYAAEDAIEFPDAPTQVGYDFAGWSMTEAEIQSAIANGNDVTVEATWTRQIVKVQVTVTNGSGTGQYNALSQVTVTANEPEDGKKFACWTDAQGNIKSYSEIYSFFPTQDTEVIAVFVSEDTVIEEQILVSLDAIDTTGEKNVFYYTWNVPAEYDFVKAGIIAVNKDNLSEATFYAGTTDNNVFDRSPSGSNLKPANSWSWSKSNVASGDTWVAKAYIQYRDTDGSIVTVYSDMVEATKD